MRSATLERILEAFAEATAAGDFDAAEGWTRVAWWRAQIETPLEPAETNWRSR